MSLFGRFLGFKAKEGLKRCDPLEKTRIRKLIDEGRFNFEFFDSDSDLTACFEEDVLATFFTNGHVNFHITVYSAASDNSGSNSITNIDQVSDI